MMRLKPLESRSPAVVLACLMLVVGYFVLVHWWFVAPLLRINDDMQTLRDTEQRYATTIAERRTAQQRVPMNSHDRSDSNLLLTGSDASATAALMQRTVDVVTAHAADGNCDVVRKMILPVVGNAKPYRKINISIRLRCGMRVFGEVLRDLEYGTPYLFVDNLGIYRNPVPTQDGSMRPLEIEFDVSGYARQLAGAASR